MARTPAQTPKLRRHKATARAYVHHRGRDHYLGPWPNANEAPPLSTMAAYSAWIDSLDRTEIEENLQKKSNPAQPRLRPSEFRVIHLVDEYLKWCDSYFKQGQEVKNTECALVELVMAAGDRPVNDFSPRDLHKARDRMVERGRTRQGCNKATQYIRRLFRWGVEYGFVNPGVLTTLECVRALKPGKTDAPESKKLGLVEDEAIEATLPFLPPAVRAIVLFCRWTGARPSEACRLRMAEVDQSDPECWVFSPPLHKTAARGRVRNIAIGPRCIAMLKDWGIPTDPEQYLFSPAQERKKRFVKMRESRKTPVQPSQQNRALPIPTRVPGRAYDTRAVACAIRRACEKAGLAPENYWSPGRLRKSAAQELYRMVGLEGAQSVLGHHDSTVTTDHYLSFEKELAKRAISKIG